MNFVRTMTRPFPLACLIINVISRHEFICFKALAYGQGVEGRECLQAGYLLFYGTSGVGRWIMQLDVSNEEQIASAAQQVKQRLHGNESSSKGLDLLINCAGMLHPSGRGETSLRAVSHEGLMTTFATNASGPLLMAKYFGEHLTKGSGEFGQSPSEGHSGTLVNMSARVGSISDNGYGGWYSYRMSKSALNMATKNLSIEFSRGRRKVVCISLHPGTVNTDLSRPYHKNVAEDKLFTPEYSVERMMEVIENLNVEDSGKFLDFAGEEIPF